MSRRTDGQKWLECRTAGALILLVGVLSSGSDAAPLPQWLVDIKDEKNPPQAVTGSLQVTIAEEPRIDRSPPGGKLQPWHQKDNSWLTRGVSFGRRPDGRWFALYNLPKYALDYETGISEAMAIETKHDARKYRWAKWVTVRGDANRPGGAEERGFGAVTQHWVGDETRLSLIETYRHRSEDYFRPGTRSVLPQTPGGGGERATTDARDLTLGTPKKLASRQMDARRDLIATAGGDFWGLTLGACPTPQAVMRELLRRSGKHDVRMNDDGSLSVHGVMIPDRINRGGRVIRYTPFAGRDLLAAVKRFEARVNPGTKQLESYRLVDAQGEAIETGRYTGLKATTNDDWTGYAKYPGMERITYPLDVYLCATRSLPVPEMLDLYKSTTAPLNMQVPSVYLLPENEKGNVKLVERELWTPQRNATFRVLFGGEPSWFLNTDIKDVRLVVTSSRRFVPAYPKGIPAGKNWRFDIGFGMVQSYISPGSSPPGTPLRDIDDLIAEQAHFDAMLKVYRDELAKHEKDPQAYKEAAGYVTLALGEIEHFLRCRGDEKRMKQVVAFLTDLIPHSRDLLMRRPRIVQWRFDRSNNTFDLHLATRIVEDPVMWKRFGPTILTAAIRSYSVTAKGLTESDEARSQDHFSFQLVEKMRRADAHKLSELRSARAALRDRPPSPQGKITAARRLNAGAAEMIRQRMRQNIKPGAGDAIVGTWHRPPRGREILRISRQGDQYIGKWETLGGRPLNFGVWEFAYDGNGVYSGLLNEKKALQVSLIEGNEIKAKCEGFVVSDIDGVQTLKRYGGGK